MARQSKWYGIRDSAEHRRELADARYDRLQLEHLRVLDRADSRRSKSWRSRDLREAAKIERRIDRAYRDRENWTRERDRAQTQIDALERRQRKRKEKPKPVKAVYEYVLKVRYDGGKRRHGRRSHSVWWDVRFRLRDGSQATKAQLEALVRAVRRDDIPFEWQRLDIAWDRGVRSQYGGWSAEPGRRARGEAEAEAALNSLSLTLGREPGEDFVFEDDDGSIIVGEERR
jgi:hypothetical protein